MRAPSTRGANGVEVVNELFIDAGKNRSLKQGSIKLQDNAAGDKPVFNALPLSRLSMLSSLLATAIRSSSLQIK